MIIFSILFHTEHWTCDWTCLLFFLSFVEMTSFLNQALLVRFSVFVKCLRGVPDTYKHFTNINLLSSHNDPMKRYNDGPHFTGEETTERVTCLNSCTSIVIKHLNPGSGWLQWPCPSPSLCSSMPSSWNLLTYISLTCVLL